MAYLNNIPQSTDQLSLSQGQILGNFVALGALAPALNSTSGLNWVQLPNQAANPPTGSAFAATDIGLYSFNNATSTKNELYINKTNASGTVRIPSTASILGSVASPAVGSDGYTYLPSGIIIQWGTGTSSNPATFAIQFPTRCIQAVITPRTAGISVFNNGMSATQLQVTSTGIGTWGYIAIGF